MNEYDIIDLLTKTAGRLPPGYSPIGDDVASLPARPAGSSSRRTCSSGGPTCHPG